MCLIAAALPGATAFACETVREGRSEPSWTLRVDAEQPWNLPESCAAALDELAAHLAANRRDLVSIEVLVHGTRPTSLLLARIAALASRIESGLLERGVRKPRIRMREFRLPDPAAGEILDASRIIVRIAEP